MARNRQARVQQRDERRAARQGKREARRLERMGGTPSDATASSQYNAKGERRANMKTDKLTGEAFDVKGIKDRNNKNPVTAGAADILRQGADNRMLDPSLARQEIEGLGGDDVTFRPEDMAFEGIGNIDVLRTGAGNFRQTITEDDSVAGFRDQLQSGATGAFDASANMRGGVERAGEGAAGAAGDIFDAQRSFDPMAVAQGRFDKLDSMLEPGRERERSGLESRLFAQGRLDSTSGAREMGEYGAAIERERADMLDRQFTEGQNAQVNQLNTAGNLTGIGAGTQGGIFNQGLGGVGGAQQLSEPMLRLMGLANDQGIASSNSKLGMVSNRQPDKGGGSFMEGPWGKLIGAGITGAATAFGGPLGGVAANAAVQGVTNATASPSSSPNGQGAMDMSSMKWS